MPTPKRNESKQDFLSRCTKQLIDKEGRKSDQAYAMCNAYWDEARAGKRNTLTLSAPVELKAGEGDDPASFLITAYTGRPVDTWFGRLVFDLKGMKTRETMPILREHMRDRIVGYGNKAWADKQNFYVSGKLSKSTPDAGEIASLAGEGFPWQASVGIWPLTIKVLDSEKETETVNGQEIRGPAEIWQESLVGEVSFVALGADGDTAAIVLSDQGAEVPVQIIESNHSDEEEQTMTITMETLKADAPELLAQIQDDARKEVDVQAAVDAALEAERSRVKEIRESAFDGQEELADKLIFEGASTDEARKQLIADQKARTEGELQNLRNSDTGDLGADPDTTEPDGGTQNGKRTAKDRGDAGNQLDALAKEMMEEKGLSYEAAFNRVCKAEPELFKAYMPAASKH